MREDERKKQRGKTELYVRKIKARGPKKWKEDCRAVIRNCINIVNEIITSLFNDKTS